MFALELYNSPNLISELRKCVVTLSEKFVHYDIDSLNLKINSIEKLLPFERRIINNTLFIIRDNVWLYKIIARHDFHSWDIEYPSFKYTDLKIDDNFDTFNYIDCDEMSKILSLDITKFRLSNDRLYFNDKNEVFEIRLWTLFAKKYETDLRSRVTENDSLNIYYNFINEERYYFARDFCYFSEYKANNSYDKDTSRVVKTWNLCNYSVSQKEDILYFSGKLEINTFRQIYEEFEFKGGWDLKSNSFNEINHSFGRWDYK